MNTGYSRKLAGFFPDANQLNFAATQICVVGRPFLMFVWRLSKFADLSGRGGLAASGRWHSRPKAVVYCADEPKTAYAEILRQIGHPSLFPEAYRLLKIQLPDSILIEHVDVLALDPVWSSASHGSQVCRPLGDHWFLSARSAVLKVPSAARIGHFNYLINTVVRDADDIAICDIFDQPFPDWVTTNGSA